MSSGGSLPQTPSGDQQPPSSPACFCVRDVCCGPGSPGRRVGKHGRVSAASAESVLSRQGPKMPLSISEALAHPSGRSTKGREQHTADGHGASIESTDQVAASGTRSLSFRVPAKDSSWTRLMRAAVTGDLKTAQKHLGEKDKKNEAATRCTLLPSRPDRPMLELLDLRIRPGHGAHEGCGQRRRRGSEASGEARGRHEG